MIENKDMPKTMWVHQEPAGACFTCWSRKPANPFDPPRYIRADITEGLAEALAFIEQEWDGEQEDMHDARQALAAYRNATDD